MCEVRLCMYRNLLLPILCLIKSKLLVLLLLVLLLLELLLLVTRQLLLVCSALILRLQLTRVLGLLDLHLHVLLLLMEQHELLLRTLA